MFSKSRHYHTCMLLIVSTLLMPIKSARSDGGSVKIPVLPDAVFGCVDAVFTGIPMFDTGSGSGNITVPGPVLYAFVEWVGFEDDTPSGTGTSTLTINGVEVEGTLAPGAAGSDAAWGTWYSWHADIGPTAAAGQQIVTNQGVTVINMSGWDATKQRNGASVTVIYDTSPCSDPKEVTFFTGVDMYYHGMTSDTHSQLLLFEFVPASSNRSASVFISHAGTDANQSNCRGGAIWMLAGTGPTPNKETFNILDRNTKGFGINGGVEIVNDPFTSSTLPCTPTLNPTPDEPYEAGHPYPGGALTAPYRALSITPSDGADIGAEWGTLEVEVQIPANAEWVVFQLESEQDQDGESGAWAGGAAFTLNDPETIADLSVTTASDTTVANLNDSVIITVTAQNVGSEDFTSANVEDAVPASLTLQSFLASKGTYNTNTGIWAIGALNIGETETLTLNVQVATDCDSTSNCAQLDSSTPPDEDPSNNTSCVTMTPAQVAFGNRITDGLVVYYPFTEDAGTTFADLSGTGMPMNLEFQSGSISFLGGRNGISIDSSSLIGTLGAGSKVYHAIDATKEFTIEIWCKPSNLSQTGPARMVSLSVDTGARNFTLGQSADDIRLRVRRAGSNNNGSDPELSAADKLDTSIQHIVATYESDGTVKIFRNALQEKVSTFAQIQNWQSTYGFYIGNEGTGDRAWLGEVYVVAIYDRPLTTLEIQQNFDEGSDVESFDTGSNIIVTGETSRCVGELGSYTISNPEGGASYSWDFGSGATPANAIGVGPHGVSWNSQATKTVQVTMTGGACGGGQVDYLVAVDCIADLAVTKTSSKSTFNDTDVITFTVQVENVGSQDFPTVEIQDVLPTALTYNTCVTTDGSYSQSTDLWTLSNLSTGEIETLTINMTVNQDCASITNCAQLSSSTPTDQNSSNDQSCVSMTPQQQALGDRVIDGLIAYYPMTEESGSTLFDQSGVSSPTDLNIESGSVSFLSGRNGISVNSSALIASSGSATWIEDRIEDDTEAFTAEIWCKPANLSQSGPARMVSFSADPYNRNFTLGQEGDDLRFRVRHNDSDSNGLPELSASNVMTTQEAHYVGVFTSSGNARLYKDGVLQTSSINNNIAGTWNSSYRFLLANEEAGVRPWMGEIYLVALYNKALSDAEILHNYNQGNNPTNFITTANLTVTGPSSICELEQGSFSVSNPVGGSTYTWNFGADATPTNATGVGPHTVSWTSQGLKTIDINTTGGPCGDGATTHNVSINCDPPGLCEGLCGIPPHLDGAVLWGIESDAGFLFSISDYNNAFSTFTNMGAFVWNNNGTLESLLQDIEAFDIGPDGTVYMAYNHDLGSTIEPVLLTYDLANAQAGGTNVVNIVGTIGVTFDHVGDNITGLSYHPETGSMYALLQDDDSNIYDRLFRIDPSTGAVLQDYGEIKGTINGVLEKVRTGEEMDFGSGGRLYVADNDDDELYEVDPDTGDIVAVVDKDMEGGTTHTSVKFEGMAYDFINDKLLGTDDNHDILVRFALEDGNNTVLDEIGDAPLNLTDVEGIDFVPVVSVPVCLPGIVWPTNTTVECPFDFGTSQTGTPSLTNFCCNLSITNVDSTVSGSCTDVVTRVWTVSDDCGISEVHTQIVTVVDSSAPVLSGVPSDTTVECDSVPAPPSVTALDACDGSVSVTLLVTTNAGACAQSFTLTRTWSAADACGNTTNASQMVTVQDTTDPVLIGVPANVTVECNAIPNPPTVTATDNCDPGPVGVNYVETTNSGSCAHSFTLTRTWSATDACGNTAMGSQIITVQDTTAPVLIGVPANATVECDAIPTPPTVTAVDNCDTSTISVNLSENTSGGSCGDSYTVTRTWSASDACGNTAMGSQIITVQDTTPPVLIGVPANATVPCESIPTPPTVTAADNCDSGSITVNLAETTNTGSCAFQYSLTRTWSAVDRCGNTNTASQQITVEDTVAPVLTGAPSDVTVACEHVPPATNVVTATDNCDNGLVVNLNITTNAGSCAQSFTLTRTWFSVDACNNTGTVSQVVTVQDTTGPTIVCPEPITITAGTALPTLTSTNITDTCDPAPVQASQVPSAGSLLGTGTNLVTLTATDACGNTNACVVQVVVIGPSTIGDFVWFDATEIDGVQGEPGEEPGASGIAVDIYNSSDTLIDSDVTDSNGFYQFQVPAGSYYLDFTAPSGFVWTIKDVAGNGIDTMDSDVDTNGVTDTFSIGTSENNPDVDAGLAPEGAL